MNNNIQTKYLPDYLLSDILMLIIGGSMTNTVIKKIRERLMSPEKKVPKPRITLAMTDKSLDQLLELKEKMLLTNNNALDLIITGIFSDKKVAKEFRYFLMEHFPKIHKLNVRHSGINKNFNLSADVVKILEEETGLVSNSSFVKAAICFVYNKEIQHKTDYNDFS
jgi:hypothetical protein